MKKIINLLFVTTVLCYGNTHAQSLISPGGTGIAFDYPASVGTLNSAYCAEYHGGVVAGHVFGAVWDDGAGGVSFNLGNDGSTILTTTAIAIPGGYTSVLRPDIIIGSNDFSTTTTDSLWLAIIYLAANLHDTDLFMDIYTIYGTSTGGGFAYGNSTTGIPITTSGNVDDIWWPHIDGITSVQPSGPTAGNVYTTDFAMSWTESGDIHVMSDNFQDAFDYYTNSSTLLTAVYNSISASPTRLHQSDIAGIQRDNTPSTIDLMGLLTYADENGKLFYQEWNISSGNSLGSPSQIDNGARMPRIDAIDPYTLNSVSAIAHYNIAYMRYDNTSHIAAYNDVNLTPFDIISYGDYIFPTTYNNDQCFPTTVCGPNANPDFTYTVAYDEMLSPYDIWAQQIDQSTGALSNSDYFVVNNASSSGVSMPALSQECNLGYADPTNIYACYYDYYATTLYYKITGTTPLSFKPGHNNCVTNTNEAGKWIAGPNPAYNNIMLNSQGNTTGDKYRVADMTGRIIEEKDINKANTIDVSRLAPGMYTIQVLNKNTKVQTIKFVKE